MPRFTFKLAAVLKQRQARERERQLAVAALEQERLQVESEIRFCQEQIAREKQDMRTRLDPAIAARGVSVRDVRAQANMALHWVAQAQAAVLRLAGVHRRLEAARGQLLAATTARKAIDTLRDRRLAAWQDEEKHREASALDELAIMRSNRAELGADTGQEPSGHEEMTV